ncbi:hypothetical protein BV898_11043 [Hypsibius exemplaris]|uniref:Uncharacterized protein n=1 Tax=Hypsibius exemplaris TaxID=2072580 RepID=A0A1W0WHU2_HYPEX|nr:hypothetical protein BV898_11043 [Hypsibius exemplaris]
MAVETKEAGVWLNALPTTSLVNLLDDASLRVTVALRLGAVVCLPHRCTCEKEVNENGHHGLFCKLNAVRHSRHSSLNDVLKRALISASVPAIRKLPGLVRRDGKRPDVMSMVPWKQGKALVWDVTVWNTMAPSHIAGSTSTAGRAAHDAELTKHRTYWDLCRFVSEGAFYLRSRRIRNLCCLGGKKQRN